MKQLFSPESAKIAFETIKKAKNILIHLHPSPDGDSVGSALSMYAVLKGMNKNVTVIKGDSNLPGYLSHLPNFNVIVPQNYFETNLSDFDLFIIQDAGAPSLISRVADITFPPHLETLIIDHHASNEGYANINIIDPSYPSTCELLFDLCKVWGVELTHDIAANLFIGMYTDTGGFRYGLTSERTFNDVAELVKLVPEFSDIILTMDSSNSLGVIKYIGMALGGIKTWHDGKIVMSIVTRDQVKAANITEDEIKPPFLNILLGSIKGAEVIAIIVEHEDNKVSASLRSNKSKGKYDVSQIASVFGGGGHKAAAGIRTTGSGIELAENIVKEIEKIGM